MIDRPSSVKLYSDERFRHVTISWKTQERTPMSLFDGLYSYEVVLLILAGSLLLTRLLPALLFDVKATGPLYLSVRGSVPGRVARHHLDPVTALRQHWRGARTHACRVPPNRGSRARGRRPKRRQHLQ